MANNEEIKFDESELTRLIQRTNKVIVATVNQQNQQNMCSKDITELTELQKSHSVASLFFNWHGKIVSNEKTNRYPNRNHPDLSTGSGTIRPTD